MDSFHDQTAVGGRDELERTDWVWAAAIAAAVSLLFVSTLQGRLNTDGAGMASQYALDRHGYHHIAWLPACRFLGALVPTSDPILIPRLVSALSGGIGTGLVWILCRAFGAPRFGSLAAILVLTSTPALWFWSTTVEIHALHFFGVALGACVTILAPWRRPALALTLTAGVFPLVYWSHQSAVMLGPGWILLVQYARSRKAPPFLWRTVFFVVGPVLLAMLLLAMAVTNLVRLGEFGILGLVENQSGFLEATKANPSEFESGRGILWDELVVPYTWFVLAGLTGVWVLRRERLIQLVIWTLCLFPTAFLVWWGVASRGGYYLDCAGFFAVFVAHGFGRFRPWKAGAALALVLLSGWEARTQIGDFDRGWDPESRVDVVRTLLPEGGVLITTLPDVPFIRIWLPEVEEVLLTNAASRAWNESQGRESPDEFLARYRHVLQGLVEQNERILFDLGYESQGDRWDLRRTGPYLDAVADYFRQTHETRRIEHPSWPMLEVRR